MRDHDDATITTGESGDAAAPLAADLFKLAFRHHPAGVAVVTADPGDGPIGITLTSVFSVSAEPPLLVFSIADSSSSAPALARAETLVVHLLTSAQQPIARLCAAHGVDRFADTSLWDRLPTGEPYFTGVETWLRGRVVGRVAAGSSTLVTVEALDARLPDSALEAEVLPLVYYNRQWHELGDRSRLDV